MNEVITAMRQTQRDDIDLTDDELRALLRSALETAYVMVDMPEHYPPEIAKVIRAAYGETDENV